MPTTQRPEPEKEYVEVGAGGIEDRAHKARSERKVMRGMVMTVA